MTGRTEILEAQRDRLVRTIEGGVEPRDLAALSRELRLVLAELEGLKGTDAGDLDDELERRRLARRGGVA